MYGYDPTWLTNPDLYDAPRASQKAKQAFACLYLVAAINHDCNGIRERMMMITLFYNSVRQSDTYKIIGCRRNRFRSRRRSRRRRKFDVEYGEVRHSEV